MYSGGYNRHFVWESGLVHTWSVVELCFRKRVVLTSISIRITNDMFFSSDRFH
jgi:hypothetical protein